MSSQLLFDYLQWIAYSGALGLSWYNTGGENYLGFTRCFGWTLVYVPLPWDLTTQHVTWLFEEDYAWNEHSKTGEKRYNPEHATATHRVQPRTFEEYSGAVVLPFSSFVSSFLFYSALAFLLLVFLLALCWILSCCCAKGALFLDSTTEPILDVWSDEEDDLHERGYPSSLA